MESTSAVVKAPGEVEVGAFEVPDVTDETALLAVELGGVCGTDPKIYDGKVYRENLPAVLGHEILGRIERIGREAKERMGVTEGDRVVVEAQRRCGDCEHCLRGRYQFCDVRPSYGFRTVEDPPGLWGAHGEYLYLEPGSTVHPIDESVPAEAAVLACAVVGNSVRWLQAGDEELVGKSLLIQGPGPQGLSMTAVAARAGLSPIVVAGLPGDEERLALAAELGADETVCARPDELVESARAALGGNADVVVNLTGVPGSVQQSVDLAAVEGTIVYPNVVGGEPSEVQLDDLVFGGVTLKGVFSRTAPYVEQAVELVERDPTPFAKLTSHTFAIDEAEAAYRTVGGKSDERPLKAVIDPSA